MRITPYALLSVAPLALSAASLPLLPGPLQAGPPPPAADVVLKNEALGLAVAVPHSFFSAIETPEPVPCKIEAGGRSFSGSIRQLDMGDHVLEWEGGSARLDFGADGARIEFLLEPGADGLRAAGERMRLAECQGAGRQLVLFLLAYAADHDGKMPAKLDDLIPDYAEDRSLMECSLAADQSNPGWAYNPKAAENEPLLVSKSADSLGRKMEVHADGTVRFSSPAK